MLNFSQEYSRLNPGQKLAVDTLDGPVMVVAGPGTGKTQVLALRVVNILRQKKARPEEILALTFSERAAVEMQKRLAQFLGSAAYDIAVKTFHAFCNDIIQDNQETFKQAKDLYAIDELEKVRTIKKIIKKSKLAHLKQFHDPYLHRGEILKNIGTLKKEGIGPGDFAESLARWEKDLMSRKTINKRTSRPPVVWQKEWKQYEVCRDLLLVYRAYEGDAAQKGWYDFDDMVLWVIDKLGSSAALCEEYRERFKYILSDEYQDTNSAQNKIIRLLADPHSQPNIFVVGDDDQSIYRFQGANLENILSFEQTYPGAAIIPIAINYRSGQAILDVSQSLIANNKERLVNESRAQFNKDLVAAGSAKKGRPPVFPEPPELYEFSSSSVEDFFLADKIKELKKEGLPYKEMAVLCRTNQEVADIADYLLRSGIPAEVSAGNSALESPAVLALIALGRAVDNPRDNEAVYKSMSNECWGIAPKDFLDFCFEASRSRASLFSYAKSLAEKAGSAQKKAVKYQGVLRFFEVIAGWNKAAAASPALVMLSRLLDESGMLAGYLAKHDLRSANSLSALFSFVKVVHQRNPEAKMAELLADLAIMKEEKIIVKERQLSTAQDDVRVLTAHNAKGSEFTAVFIPRLYRGGWDGKVVRENIRLPKNLITHQHVRENSKEEDERRLFFVALTRAKLRLFLSRSQVYEGPGGVREKAPSKFLAEIGPDLLKTGNVGPYEDRSAEIFAVELKARNKGLFAQEAEEAFIAERVSSLSLNPTSLNTYLACPLRFKYEKLLMVPTAKTKSAALGTAVHAALEEFFRAIMRAQKVSVDDLLGFFEMSLAKEIMNRDEHAETLIEGKKILADYYKEYQGRFVTPLALETSIKNIPLEDVLLSGKIDKIEPVEGDFHKGVKVIDYKTMKPKNRNAIKGETKASDGDIYRQLVFYKLLSVLDKNFPYDVIEAEVDFVRHDKGKFKKESFVISVKDVEELKETILETAANIRAMRFEPKRDFNACRYCNLKDLCQNL